ncbi:MAG: hypothetical protein P3W96_011765 [Halomonas sp.]|jgi:hypothetical protein|nr:hypothetical protein [Halomonas sp.]MDM7482668.1 hypothetical protein [Halomonas sp.]
MGKVRQRKETGKLYLDFFYQGLRLRVMVISGVWKQVEGVAYPVG